MGSGPRLASVVVFVRDLEASVAFYRELLRLKVTARTATAALLMSGEEFQLYLRAVGAGAERPLGGIGVQYVIWTADGFDGLRHCETVLKARAAHVSTWEADGFHLVEGRDPSGVPLIVAYPGPDETAGHEIMSRIYA